VIGLVRDEQLVTGDFEGGESPPVDGIDGHGHVARAE
jgi:hypothetical protein